MEVFVIFHKKLYPEMYEDLDPEERKCLRFIAVNPEIPKEYDSNIFTVENEWEFDYYNPEWQKNNWMNGGVNHHLIMNNKLTKKWAGFVQYDMKFPKGSIKEIQTLLEGHPDRGVSIKTMNFVNLVGSSTYGFSEIDFYYFTKSQLDPVKSEMFPLFHVCFMESDKWYEIQGKLLEIDKQLYQYHNRPGDPVYRWAITTERTLAIACASVLKEVLEVNKISHLRLY